MFQVNSAYYGNFASCSEGTCCVPDPGNDCQESVKTNSPIAWETLLGLCDNQTSCEVPNAGGILQSCDPINAEYLTIRYKCETSQHSLRSVTSNNAYAKIISINYVCAQRIKLEIISLKPCNFAAIYKTMCMHLLFCVWDATPLAN